MITHDTNIYQDITADNIIMEVSEDGELPEMPEAREFKLKIKPGNVDDIGANSLLTVWGERRGDRIISDVVLYQLPPQLPEINFSNP